MMKDTVSSALSRMEPHKMKAILAMLTAAVNDYLNKVNLLFQTAQRQRRLLQLLATVRQRKKAKAGSPSRQPVNCCPSVRNLLLDYLHNDQLPFERHFRVGRATFRRICAIFSRPRASGWTRELELLIFLHWLGMGASYRAIAGTFGIPRSTIHNVVYRYVNNLVNHLTLLIHPPRTDAKLREVGEGFAELCSSDAFARAGGVIDTCCITPSSGDTPVLMQALCDSHGRFLDFSVGYPPDMEPSEVFRASPLFEKGDYPPEGYFLIGGEGYPCLSSPVAVMPPFHKPLQDEAEVSFNAVCNRALTVLHDALGQMTSRWKLVFERRLTALRQRTIKVVAICAMIHNICVDEGDVWNDADDDVADGGFGMEFEPAGDFSWCVPGDEEKDDEGGVMGRESLAQMVLSETSSSRVHLEHDYCGPEEEGDIAEVEEEQHVEVYYVGEGRQEVVEVVEPPDEEAVMDHDYLVAAEECVA
ncbi:unnamed protein product [Ixodes hexagonus]